MNGYETYIHMPVDLISHLAISWSKVNYPTNPQPLATHPIPLQPAASDYRKRALTSERAISKYKYLSGIRVHKQCYQRLQTIQNTPLPARHPFSILYTHKAYRSSESNVGIQPSSSYFQLRPSIYSV